jgi:hypothetical protein
MLQAHVSCDVVIGFGQLYEFSAPSAVIESRYEINVSQR